MVEQSASQVGLWGWLVRPSLGRRIAVAMVLSLVAIQAQAFLQIWLFSKPEFRLTGTRWLAELTQEAAHAAFAVPAGQRNEVLRKRSEGTTVRLYWSPTLPWTAADESGDPIAAQLTATLRETLGNEAKGGLYVSVSALNFRLPTNSVRLVIAPEEVKARVAVLPIREGEPEVLIPAGVRIAVQGQDASWVMIEPVGFEDSAFGLSLPYAPLLAGGIIIAAVSTLLARRLVAPLDRLVVAADRIGTAREPVRVDTTGLHEFSAVARAFEDMQQRLLRFVEDRTRILAAISHDLRSSLTRLRLVAEQCQGPDERDALTMEIQDMQSMVESTLAFASGEARMTPTRPTDIAALLISLVDEAVDAGRACDYQGPNHIETMAHPVSLKRAFWNVIDNAIKYGGSARVSLTVGAASLTIRIDDDGPGIPDEAREDVFAPFRRLDQARGHAMPGTGLGLTIARDVIQSHGGTIALCNRASGGLSATIELPLRSHA